MNFPSAATLAAVPAGERPAGGDRPVATVVIPGGGEGDRTAGSPGVKVSVGWDGIERPGRIRQGGKQLDRPQQWRTSKAPKSIAHLKRMVGVPGVPKPLGKGEGMRHRRRNWVHAADGLPGVREGGMSRRSG
jgi:hypothetical protein